MCMNMHGVSEKVGNSEFFVTLIHRFSPFNDFEMLETLVFKSCIAQLVLRRKIISYTVSCWYII